MNNLPASWPKPSFEEGAQFAYFAMEYEESIDEVLQRVEEESESIREEYGLQAADEFKTGAFNQIKGG